MINTEIKVTDVDLDPVAISVIFRNLSQYCERTAEKGLSVHTGNHDLCKIYADTDVHAPFLLNSFLWHERINNFRSDCMA